MKRRFKQFIFNTFKSYIIAEFEKDKEQILKEYSLDQLLSKVKNGKEKYHTDPVFNICVPQLLIGVEPIVLIYDLTTIISGQQSLIDKAYRTWRTANK